MASFPFDASATSFKSGSEFTNAAMPFRKRGWSSTVRIRIRSRVLCTIFYLTKQFRPVAFTRGLVSNACGNGQLNLRSGSGLAPEIEFSSNSISAFTHSLQSPMPCDSAILQYFRIDTFAIVANPKPQHLVIVSDLRFNPGSTGVAIRISHDLECDPANLILGGGGQGMPISLLDKLKDWRLLDR